MAKVRISSGTPCLTDRQYQVLCALSRNPPASMAEIAREWGVKRVSVYTHMGRLMQLGYVELRPDRHWRKYRLSPRGRDLVKRRRRQARATKKHKKTTYTEARDRWFHHHALLGVKYKWLLDLQFTKDVRWPRLHTAQSIKKHAIDYARRHGLPVPGEERKKRGSSN